MKHLNIFIFIFLSSIFLLFSSHIKFSTHFLEVFFSKESIRLFTITSKLELSNNILIAKKGLNKTALNELYLIAEKLKKMKGISKVTLSLEPSADIQAYYKKNYYLLSDFNTTHLSRVMIREKLQNSYDKLQNSYIYTPLDTHDPLNLFHIDIAQGDRYLKLKEYGYVLKAKTNIDTSSAAEAKILYDKVHRLLKPYRDILVYAPFFFLVENSMYIRNDTQNIIAIATLLLLLLYFILLKNYKLLFHTIIAIASSVLTALLASVFVFGNINIMVLAFGISISTISIDYMFHYYFHGDFSIKNFIWRKKVFFGFLTSFGVFVIFTFIDIKLFYELAFFSAVSLFVAYILFSWVFSYLNIQKPILESTNKLNKGFNPLYLLLGSLLLLSYSFTHLQFDDDLRNLDYKNVKLLNLSKKFREGLKYSQYQTILLSANTQELLLQKYEILQTKHPRLLGIGKLVLSKKKCKQKIALLKKFNFEKIHEIINTEAENVGFKKDTFMKSYASVAEMSCNNLYTPTAMDFKIVQVEKKYYTVALLPKKENISLQNGVEILNIASYLSKDMQKSKQSIVKFMIISILFIVCMLFIVSGIHMLYPLVYILFPLSTVLFMLSLLGSINIMHIFAMIILIAIGIDYGVYMHNTKTVIETRTSIKYALLSTLAGFGVLIFSDTVALHSIGLVISIGIGSIFMLLYWRKI